jgi:hypothetical protein
LIRFICGPEVEWNTTTSPRCGSHVETTFTFSSGRRNPYLNLLTRMKSPSTSPGIIEAEGIRNGSNRNARSNTTNSKTGISERA